MSLLRMVLSLGSAESAADQQSGAAQDNAEQGPEADALDLLHRRRQPTERVRRTGMAEGGDRHGADRDPWMSHVLLG
ncbi:MAG TPA: hypothetical protein VHN14_19335 [Kofleriaceae bacterium]|jgi:hypothetical protein|nr:hypothetical protein [Kofleriaceae bacterium]